MARLQQWSEAAILGEPEEYLYAVWLDTIRLVDPNHYSYGDLSADELIASLLGPESSFTAEAKARLYPGDRTMHRGDVGPLKSWERITRVDGVWMVILLALCLVGPWVLRGRARSGMLLFALSALTLLFFPILVSSYDYRYVIPAFPPLLAAGVLAAWGLVVRVRPALVRRRRPLHGSRAS
jgi:hypothetical protein